MFSDWNVFLFKLDQGALGMSDPLGPIKLALKPASVSSADCLQLYFCAHWSVVPCQVVGLESPRGSRGRPTGSQGVKGLTYRVQGGQGVCLQGPRVWRGRPTGSQEVKFVICVMFVTFVIFVTLGIHHQTLNAWVIRILKIEHTSTVPVILSASLSLS